MKKDLSRQIDELIISCAIGNGYDEAKLMRLASEYGTMSDSYKFSKMNLAFDFEHEKQIASQLEKEVNDYILRFRSALCSPKLQIYKELGRHGTIFKNKPRKPSKTSSKCTILGGKRRTRINSKRRRS